MINTVVFDLGNVLIRWNPANLYRKWMSEEECSFFLQEVCPLQWHSLQDAGADISEAMKTRAALFPHHASDIEAYYGRWKEMFGGTIDETVEILEALKKERLAVFALSNWNRELFAQTEADYPFLQLFDDIVLSGDVGAGKPDPAIYQHLLRKHKLQPEQTFFIDDRQENVDAAAALGMHIHLFTGPAALKENLTALKILNTNEHRN